MVLFATHRFLEHGLILERSDITRLPLLDRRGNLGDHRLLVCLRFLRTLILSVGPRVQQPVGPTLLDVHHHAILHFSAEFELFPGLVWALVDQLVDFELVVSSFVLDRVAVATTCTFGRQGLLLVGLYRGVLDEGLVLAVQPRLNTVALSLVLTQPRQLVLYLEKLELDFWSRHFGYGVDLIVLFLE